MPALSLAQARRLVLRAQGIERAPARAADAAAVTRAARRMGVIQIDSVNVLARAHYMPLYSRIGPYERDALDRLFSHTPRRLLEQWGHEACLVTPDVHQLLAPLRHRWAQAHRARTELNHPGITQAVLRVVEEHGPITSREIQRHLEEEFPAPTRDPGEHGWWSW